MTTRHQKTKPLGIVVRRVPGSIDGDGNRIEYFVHAEEGAPFAHPALSRRLAKLKLAGKTIGFVTLSNSVKTKEAFAQMKKSISFQQNIPKKVLVIGSGFFVIGHAKKKLGKIIVSRGEKFAATKIAA